MSTQALQKLVRVQSNRVTRYVYLPREICRKLNLDRGSLLMVTIEGDAIVLRPVEIQVKKRVEGGRVTAR